MRWFRPWRLWQANRTMASTGVDTSGLDAGDVSGVEDVYHEAASAFLEHQLHRYEILDGRTFQIFTIGSTVLPLTFALLSLTSDEAPASAGWLLGAALMFYVVLIVCAAAATRYRLIEYRPESEALAELVNAYRSATTGGAVLREWIAREYVLSFEQNRPLLASKGRWVSVLSAMLFVECFCLALAAGVTLFL